MAGRRQGASPLILVGRRLLVWYGLVFGRPSLYGLNRFLMHLALRGLGIQNWETERGRGERDFLRILFADAPASPVVIDVGAHVGDYTAMVLSFAPMATVYAVEPNSRSQSALSRRFPHQDVHCLEVAMGSEPGKVLLYDDPRDPGSSHSSVIPDVFERIHGVQPLTNEVTVDTLSALLRRESLNDIFLLKIDVEGAELDVIEGLEPALDDPNLTIRNIQIEFNEMNVLSRSFLAEFVKKLPRYRAYRILPRGLTLDISAERPMYTEIFGYQNIVFRLDDTVSN